MKNKGIYTLLFFALLIVLCFCFVNQVNAYFGLYGGLYGMYGGLYGMYGGLYGMYGGLYGMYGSLYGPFSYINLYYPVETAGGLTYQVPFLQIAPLLGIAALYNQLFPNLFNPLPTPAPIVNVTTPATQFVTFPTPVGVVSIT